ncbi:hypothetical protein VIGAN_04076200 [Vigna angularis var. angularis]|uniref:Uncharacterized protein n=1 Tax=Vigna angularis var. angularis TaxID=157739 RepID=A0A0S3RSQ2_PHAAN|nr:hypothetical protein VIGAN_04076200 [Vigna angularis var. angularis]
MFAKPQVIPRQSIDFESVKGNRPPKQKQNQNERLMNTCKIAQGLHVTGNAGFFRKTKELNLPAQNNNLIGAKESS